VNYSKSGLVPLNMIAEKAEIMAGVFGCHIQEMPFTYLGLPMGTMRPRVEHFEPIMNRMERQLTSISSLLTHAGRLKLVNSVLSTSPTYTMCYVSIPLTVHEYFDRIRRHCMWKKSDFNSRSKPMIAWKKCTKPKRKGGLGIINLRAQNQALLLKHLDKFYNKKDIPWVKIIWNSYYSNGEVPHASKDKGSFWWRDVQKLVDQFRGIATCTVGDGTSVLFWSDVWNGNLLQQKFPRLFSFAKNKNILVAQFLMNNQLETQFHLPLSEQAFLEYQELQEIISSIQVDNEAKDSWHYAWGNNTFTSSRCYHYHFNNFQPPIPFIWIWDSCCANKIKVFSWFLLVDRLNVRNILRRKRHKLQGNDYTCVLCSAQTEETTFHLIFSCPFSLQCWNHLKISWRFGQQFHSMMEEAELNFNSKFFMEVFILGCW
jgi:hypothetical protein